MTFYNILENAITLNQRLCGFNFVIFLVILVRFDTHHCPFTLSYRKPVNQRYTLKIRLWICNKNVSGFLPVNAHLPVNARLIYLY